MDPNYVPVLNNLPKGSQQTSTRSAANHRMVAGVAVAHQGGRVWVGVEVVHLIETGGRGRGRRLVALMAAVHSAAGADDRWDSRTYSLVRAESAFQLL